MQHQEAIAPASTASPHQHVHVVNVTGGDPKRTYYTTILTECMKANQLNCVGYEHTGNIGNVSRKKQ
eukprot:5088454-Amphidinium_carterae.1